MKRTSKLLMMFAFTCILLAGRAYGQFPLLYTSNFAGTDGCNQIFLATAQSVTNAAGQDVIVDLKGDQGCAANPIASGFTGNLRFYNGAVFHLSTSSSTWIVPSKVTIVGAGDLASISTSTGTVLQACPTNTVTGCPAAFPTDTPLMCFVDCTTTSTAQGFSISVWYLTLDCDYVAGCISVRNYHAQENSGLYHDTIINWGNNGRGIDMGSAGGGTSGYHSTLWRLNVGNTSTSNGTPVCQLGAVGVYVVGATANSTVNPGSISDVTVANDECNMPLHSTNGWPVPDYEWEISGGNASIHNVHNEYMGVAGALIGGNTPGLGAQVSVASSEGSVSSCSITGSGTNPGMFYNRSGMVNFSVYASSGSGGAVTVTFGSTGCSATSNCVTACTVASGGSGYPSTGLLAPIDDSAVAVGAQNLLTENVEACCAVATGSSTDNIRIQSSGSYSGVTLINTNQMTNPTTNVINDQTHAPITGHNSVALYMLNDAGGVTFDSSGTNQTAYQGVWGAANTVRLATTFSSSSTTLTTFLTLPAITQAQSFHCAISWKTNSAVGLNLGIQAGATPAHLEASATIYVSSTTFSAGQTGDITTNTSTTSIVSSSNTAAGGTFLAYIDGTLQPTSGTSTSLAISGASTSSSIININPRSYCSWLP